MSTSADFVARGITVRKAKQLPLNSVASTENKEHCSCEQTSYSELLAAARALTCSSWSDAKWHVR